MRLLISLIALVYVTGCVSPFQNSLRRPAANTLDNCDFYTKNIPDFFGKSESSEFGYQLRNNDLCEGTYESFLVPPKGGVVVAFYAGQLSFEKPTIDLSVISHSKLGAGPIFLHGTTPPTVSLFYRIDSPIQSNITGLNLKMIQALSLQPHEFGFFGWTLGRSENEKIYFPIIYPGSRSTFATILVDLSAYPQEIKRAMYRFVGKQDSQSSWQPVVQKVPEIPTSPINIQIPFSSSEQNITLEIQVSNKKIGEYQLLLPAAF